jgi:hypothetical protein
VRCAFFWLRCIQTLPGAPSSRGTPLYGIQRTRYEAHPLEHRKWLAPLDCELTGFGIDVILWGHKLPSKFNPARQLSDSTTSCHPDVVLAASNISERTFFASLFGPTCKRGFVSDAMYCSYEVSRRGQYPTHEEKAWEQTTLPWIKKPTHLRGRTAIPRPRDPEVGLVDSSSPEVIERLTWKRHRFSTSCRSYASCPRQGDSRTTWVPGLYKSGQW